MVLDRLEYALDETRQGERPGEVCLGSSVLDLHEGIGNGILRMIQSPLNNVGIHRHIP